MSVTEQQRDELVERLFGAGLGMAEILTVYLGDTLGLYRALQGNGADDRPRAGGGGGDPPPVRPGVARAAGGGRDRDRRRSPRRSPTQRRYGLPEGHEEPLLDPESPYWIAAFCKSFVAVAGVMPELVSAFRSGGPVPWDAYGRDMIEAQGDFNRWWLVGSFGTEYLPSIPDLHERLVERREGRGRRVRCRLGRDLARPRVPERHRGRVRPRRVLDRDRPAQRRRGRGGRPGDVRGPRRGRPRAPGRVRLRDGDRGDPRPVAARRGARRDPRDAQARRHADRGRRADRGRVHGARERDRAALLRVQRPVLSALGDGRPLVRGDRHRHAPGRRSSATRRRRGSTRSRSCRSNTTSSASTGSTASLPR